jgi:hypothetical protein
LALATACAAAIPANAATIVNTGPGGDALDGYTLNPDQSLAGRFIVAAPTLITGVSGWIGAYQSSTLTISLYSDSALTPGVTLYSASTPIDVQGRENAKWRGVDGQSWLVGPGAYWVGFSAGALETMVSGAPQPLDHYAYYGKSNGYWIDSGKSLDLGIQVFGQSPPSASGAVPEPATWVMMLLGFGMTGFAMRKRSNVRMTVSYG